MFWIPTSILILYVIFEIAFRAHAANIIAGMYETVPPLRARNGSPQSTAERVAFKTADGIQLCGSLYRNRQRVARGLVLFCPEMGSNHWIAMDYCRGLFEAGFDILSFDFRNQGESESQPGYSPTHWVTEFELRDATAAVAYIRSRNDLATMPLGIYGISRGGGVALAMASRVKPIRRVVADSAFSADSMMYFYACRWAELYIPIWLFNLVPKWHLMITLRIARRLSQWRTGLPYVRLESGLPRLAGRSVLLISGQRDNYVQPPVTESLRQSIGSDCDVWLVPKAKHNMARSVAADEYDRRIVDVFNGLETGPPEGNAKPSNPGMDPPVERCTAQEAAS